MLVPGDAHGVTFVRARAHLGGGKAASAMGGATLTVQKTRMRTDWCRLLIDLERQGYRPNYVSCVVDVPRSTILGWKNLGVEPRHDEGERLIKLWCDVMELVRDDLPKNADDLLSAAKAK